MRPTRPAVLTVVTRNLSRCATRHRRVVGHRLPPSADGVSCGVATGRCAVSDLPLDYGRLRDFTRSTQPVDPSTFDRLPVPVFHRRRLRHRCRRPVQRATLGGLGRRSGSRWAGDDVTGNGHRVGRPAQLTGQRYGRPFFPMLTTAEFDFAESRPDLETRSLAEGGEISAPATPESRVMLAVLRRDSMREGGRP
jgi:hypothetical protein